MKKEIERKFIVLDSSYKQLGEYEHCIQGYISSINEPLVRIRIIGNKSFITLKSDINGITRLEYEYKIPNNDAKDLLNIYCKKKLLKKIDIKFIINQRFGRLMNFWEIIKD